ncbi:hypothetical protein Y032_0235g3166 [Ancylostoma ceylanicum]|uniref:Uncharacterized protein n=1 Tax=Ancylostoma ceylanicum TaxID=53326 RepID=A0A016SFK3_9BILA|nr:hypothetical protein Y032_0235g3166 [Ancylostoma ceylanicum]
MFLHEGPNENLHIYYSEETLEMACRHGLFALVGDGVHSCQPSKMAQLYTVHAVCGGGIEMPVLHAITSKKTMGVITTIQPSAYPAPTSCRSGKPPKNHTGL